MHLKPDSSLRRHAHPVCQLAYNSVYQEAISADESGLICVWKVQFGTFSRVPMHASYHGASSRRPVSVDIKSTGIARPASLFCAAKQVLHWFQCTTVMCMAQLLHISPVHFSNFGWLLLWPCQVNIASGASKSAQCCRCQQGF